MLECRRSSPWMMYAWYCVRLQSVVVFVSFIGNLILVRPRCAHQNGAPVQSPGPRSVG